MAMAGAGFNVAILRLMEHQHMHEALLSAKFKGEELNSVDCQRIANASLPEGEDFQQEYRWTRQNREGMPEVLIKETVNRITMSAWQLGIMGERAQLGQRTQGISLEKHAEIHGDISTSLAHAIESAHELEAHDLLRQIERNPQLQPYYQKAIDIVRERGTVAALSLDYHPAPVQKM